MASRYAATQCVYCDVSGLDLRSLTCHHNICKRCSEKEKKNSSLVCKTCLHITSFNRIRDDNYDDDDDDNDDVDDNDSIVTISSGAKAKYKMCSGVRCYTKAEKFCIICPDAYCELCSIQNKSGIICLPCKIILCPPCSLNPCNRIRHTHTIAEDNSQVMKKNINVSGRSKEKTDLITNMMQLNLSLSELNPNIALSQDEITEALLDKEIEKINYDFEDFNHDNM